MSTETPVKATRRKAQDVPEPIAVSDEEYQTRINQESDKSEVETLQKELDKRKLRTSESDESVKAEEPIPFEETEAFKKAMAETAALRAEVDAKKQEKEALEEKARKALEELTEEKKKVRYPEEPKPGPYVVAHHFEWITAEEGSDIEGFSIYVRTSITNFEKRKLNEKDDWIHENYVPQWDNASREERSSMKSPREYQRELIAPYIYDWNAQGLNNDTGETEPIPAPREYGPDVFDFIGETEFQWLAYVILGGYTVTGKAGPWLDALRTTGSQQSEEEETEEE